MLGYQDELRDFRRFLAWHASVVIRPHVKKAVSPSELLGEQRQTPGPMPGIFLDRESLVEAIKEQRARLARESESGG